MGCHFLLHKVVAALYYLLPFVPCFPVVFVLLFFRFLPLWLVFFSGVVVFLSSFCGSVVDFCVSASLLGLSVRFCTCPLRMKSVSYGLHALLSISPTGFQSQLFWGTRLPRVGPLGLGSLMWALNMGFSPCYMGRTSAVIIVPPFGDHPPRSMSLDYTVLLPLIFASLFFLFASLIVEDLCY